MNNFTQQTGFRRGHPRAICQDQRMLLKVREFNFNLNDEKFIAYFEARTGVAISESPRTSYKVHIKCTADEWEDAKHDIMTSQDRYKQIMRGRLEDAWELWQTR